MMHKQRGTVAALLFLLVGASAFATVPAGHALKIPGSSTKSTTTTTTTSLSSRPNSFLLRATPDDTDSENNSNNKWLVPGIALASVVSLSLAAKIGALPGPPNGSGSFDPYTDAMILQDVGATLLTGTLGYIFVKANTWAAEKGYVNPKDSRKIIHTLSAPLFVVFWPLFSTAFGARFFAASVSLANACRLYIAGSGGDKSLAFAVSRSGDSKEALGGPFLYVIILFASIVLAWRDSPVGVIALSAMAAGDGLADLLGRRYGANNKWFFNRDKSMAGTLAFFVGSTLCAWILLQVLWIDLLPSSLVPADTSPELLLCAIMLASSILEVVPWGKLVDDNWVVPLGAAVMAAVAFS